MIGDCDPCDCTLEARIQIHLPEGHERMSERAKEFHSYVTCAHCGKILRYAGVVRSRIPGFRWQTVPLR